MIILTVSERQVRKLCVLGDGAVGKTSLIRRFVINVFRDRYISSIGTKVSKKKVILTKYEKEITLLLWDIIGQKEFKNVLKKYYMGSAGIILVCDSSRPETFSSLQTWYDEITAIAGHIPFVVLINKSDLTAASPPDFSVVNDFVDKYNGEIFHTSAKTGQNVNKAFSKIGELIEDNMTMKKAIQWE